MPMLHTLQPIRAHLHGRFSSSRSPALTIDSGDEVRLSVPDVGWGLEPPTSATAPRRKVEPRDPIADDGPCMLGPIAVRGAQPGDTLAIEIVHIRTSTWGWTYAGKGMSSPPLNAALGVSEAPLTLMRWTIDHTTLRATNRFQHSVDVRPFFGTIGLAPDEHEASGWVPRRCGGNMDCRELIAGSTLYLPVMTAGGMLSLGDGHAAQGDGELSGTAIECAIDEARVRVTLHKLLHVRGPRAKTPSGWVTMAFGPDLDTAASEAAAAMLDWMVEEFGFSRADALALASTRVSLRITQMVNPLRGVHALLMT